MSVHPVALGFERAADAYELARPGFPRAAVDHLAERLDLRPGRRVLDLAAGTGKLTRELATTGAEVVAVEPLAAMREQLRAVVPAGVEVLEGVAEAIPLADRSVDAATVAQAFHWFDRPVAYRELARVLRPGGGLAIVWNMRDTSDPLQARLEALLKPHRDAAATSDWDIGYDHEERELHFGPWQEWRHPWTQEFDRELLAERVRSTSFVAGMPAEEQAAFLAEAVAAAEGLPERFPFPYVTEIFICFRHTETP